MTDKSARKSRRWFRIVLYFLLFIVVAGAMAWMFGPREPVDLTVRFDPASISEDVSEWVAQRDAGFDDIRDTAAREIVWAYPASHARTPVSFVYLHGFSAAKNEIRPVPDMAATALHANLYYTRLTGHGRDGDAMSEATVNAWIQDAAEAIAVGKRIGEKVVIVSTSTGGALAALATSLPELKDRIAGLVLISPNFAIRSSGAFALIMPFARSFVPLIVGKERGFEPLNSEHGANWTTRYPSVALLPMAALVKRANALPFEEIKTPALFIYHPDDQVVDQSVTQQIVKRWGGPASEIRLTASDDRSNHVNAGDIISPSNNDLVANAIADFAGGL